MSHISISLIYLISSLMNDISRQRLLLRGVAALLTAARQGRQRPTLGRGDKEAPSRGLEMFYTKRILRADLSIKIPWFCLILYMFQIGFMLGVSFNISLSCLNRFIPVYTFSSTERPVTRLALLLQSAAASPGQPASEARGNRRNVPLQQGLPCEQMDS